MEGSDFSLEDYMSGVPLPEPVTQSAKPRKYIYGVVKNYTSEVIYSFVKRIDFSKDAYESWRKKVSLTGNILISNTVVLKENFEQVNTLAHNMLTKYMSSKDEETKSSLYDGAVAEYIDEHGRHRVLVLEVGKRYSKILFLTSNRDWGRREVTEEEYSLLGLGVLRLKSYFAPVVRPNSNITCIGIEYPSYRIEELKEEFFAKK